jgi:hypothetical protein
MMKTQLNRKRVITLSCTGLLCIEQVTNTHT